MKAALARIGRRERALGAVFGVLFVGLALAGMGQLTWPQYTRLVLLVLAVAVGWRYASAGSAAPLLAAALVAAAVQLCPPMSSGLGVALWLGLVAVAGAGLVVGGPVCAGFGVLDWTVGGVALGILGLSAGAAALYGLAELWPAALQWVLYAAVWLVLGRWIRGLATLERRWLLAPAAVVLGVVCLVGGTRVSAALYQFRTAKSAEAGDEDAAAVARYRRASELAQRLGLAALEERSRLGLARSLAGQGELDAAKGVLGIPADQVIAVEDDQWEGPTGALLFKNVSCWTDLWLWEGTVAVELHAVGQAARGEWPRLRVELAGEELGVVEVASARDSAHTFTARVATGRQRLEVSLVNGLWTSGGEHRWVRLGRAQLRYGDRGT